MHLAMREGARHALTLGADGIAILAGRPESDEDTADVREARRRGHAVSLGSIQEGAIGIAAPIRVSDWSTASLGVVQLGLKLVDDQVPRLVTEAAATAATRLVGAAGP
jgi:DNA-binding IclR family transcriptional regulator